MKHTNYFSYLGRVGNFDLFAIIEDNGKENGLSGIDVRYKFFKMDTLTGTIKRTNYIDPDLSETSTSYNGNPTITDLVTLEQTVEFFNGLAEINPVLDLGLPLNSVNMSSIDLVCTTYKSFRRRNVKLRSEEEIE